MRMVTALCTADTRAVLHFAGGNIEELRQAFADTIADYREWCKERGVEREKPIPVRSHCESPRSFIAASPNRPRRRAKALINSSQNASKKWRNETRGGTNAVSLSRIKGE